MREIEIVIDREEFREKLGLKDGLPGKTPTREELLEILGPFMGEKIIERVETIREIEVERELVGSQLIEVINDAPAGFTIDAKRIANLPKIIHQYSPRIIPTKGGTIESLIAGPNISIDSTDPANPIISAQNDEAAIWGLITGDIANQADLAAALSAKYDASNPSGFISNLSAFDTDDLAEGLNLYYTQARFNTAFAAKSTTDLLEGTNLYYTQARFNTAFGLKTTSDLLEGSNLYYTAARFNSAFSGKSTSDLSEGSNLYYTDVRADARITAQKGLANGLATLDAGGKIPTTQLPALALTDVFVVGSEAAQLALTVEEGDVAIRSDLNKSYIHNGGTAGTMADWSELLTPTDTVLSVNGQTGAVVLTTTNIAEGTNLYFTDERAQDAVGNSIGVGLDYDDSSGAISVDLSELDHGSLGGLTDDDHTQYPLLAGRSGGQTLKGGTGASEILAFLSTNHATKGMITFGAGTNSGVDLTTTFFEERGSWVFGNNSPTMPSLGTFMHVYGPETADRFISMGTDPASGPAFNFGYSGFSFGRGSAFFNVRPDASATGINPSMRFLTNNSVAIVVDKNQKITLGGSANPLTKLDVAGSVRITATASSTLTGTANPTASVTLVGTSTLFLTELVPGDSITINGETRIVMAIASDTSLTVDQAFTDTASASITKLPAIEVFRNSSNVLKGWRSSNGGVYIGGAPTTFFAPGGTQTPYLTVVTALDEQAQLGVENTHSTGLNAAALIRTASDSARINFQSHGSGRTISRWGVTLGGWNELIGVTGNGFAFGTTSEFPMIFGTASINRQEFSSSETAVVFNQTGANWDLRMEGDTEANLFFLDASTDFIGIGLNAPAARLHVQNNDGSGAPTILAENLGNGAGNIHLTTRRTGAGNAGIFRFKYYDDAANLVESSAIAGVIENITSAAKAGALTFLTQAAAASTASERMRISSVGNVKIAGTANRATTEGTNHLDIFNGTAPVGTLANGISLYSTAGELRVMDAAGNATLLSPHDQKTNEWIMDTYVGKGKNRKRIVVDMQKMMYAINKKFGWDFIHEFEIK